MFRQMRRARQQLSGAQAEEILREGSFGTLALAGDEGYPYAVPISYVYDGDAIYFHGARSGHKYDSVCRCDKASFCVVGQDEVVPEKFSTNYKSVVVFGRISVVTDAKEIYTAAEKLGRRYAPEASDECLRAEIDGSAAALCIMKLEIRHMTGKQSKFLAGGES